MNNLLILLVLGSLAVIHAQEKTTKKPSQLTSVDNREKVQAKGLNVARAVLKMLRHRCILHKRNLFRFMLRMCWLRATAVKTPRHSQRQ